MALLKWITLLQVLLLLPTYTIASCQNIESFTKEVDGELRYCKWFRFKEWRREEHCLDHKMRINCPQVCTGCCEDSPTFEFKLKRTKKVVTCAWLTANSNKKKERVRNYCPPSVSQNGRSIRDACPKSCNFCFAEITASPTSRPSLSVSPTNLPSTVPSLSLFPSPSPTLSPSVSEMPSQFPSVIPSELPTNQPTRPPSPQPSPFPTFVSLHPSATPTNKPSRSPSVNPSRYPSVVPTLTVYPTDAPSQFPSKSPSSSPSNQPSRYPSDEPSRFPSADPSQEPSRSPSDQPSHAPSSNPSQQPSISAFPSSFPSDKPSQFPSILPSFFPSKPPSEPPTSSPTIHCYDKKWFKFALDSSGEEKKCDWIFDNPYKRAVRREKYCNRLEIKLKCKESCDKCWCLDDPNYTFETNSSFRTVNCAWISQNPKHWQTRVDNYCGTFNNPTDVANYCTRSCKYCTDEKSDSPSTSPTSTQSPSERPTTTPSQGPSAWPTSTPSNSQMPSIPPTQYPTASAMPSNIPSLKPSRSPTESIKPSAKPSASPSAGPTISSRPSNLPSTYPSLSSQPSRSPSVIPSSSPSTMKPTYNPTIECVDDSTFDFLLENGNARTCSWITGNSRNTPQRIAAYCPSAHVRTRCPATCKFCQCKNDTSFKFVIEGGEKKHCKWIDLNPFKIEQRRSEWCGTCSKPSELANKCPEACGFCSKIQGAAISCPEDPP